MPVGRAGGERSVCRGEEDVSEARGGGGAGRWSWGCRQGMRVTAGALGSHGTGLGSDACSPPWGK